MYIPEDEVDFIENFYKEENKMKYKFSKGLKKGVVSFVIFALPLVLANYSDIANLTIGGLGVIIVNYLKVRYDL